METLIGGKCPDCGAELTLLETREPHEYEDVEEGDQVLDYTCFDCDWRGQVSADTDVIIWEEIFRG